MKFNFKKVTDADWEFIPDWYKGYKGWEAEIPREFVPGNGLFGYIVYKEDTPIAACWLYLTNSLLGCINPFVANPNYRDDDRKEAIKELIDFMTKFAYESGCRTLWGHTESPTLAETYKGLGFEVDPSFEVNKDIL